MKSQGILKVIRIHLLGITNICNKICANPAFRCLDISLEYFNLLVVIEEKSMNQ